MKPFYSFPSGTDTTLGSLYFLAPVVYAKVGSLIRERSMTASVFKSIYRLLRSPSLGTSVLYFQ